MGDEYNHLGKVCESSKQAKGEEICMGNYKNFRQTMFLHEQQGESKKESLELEQPWRENYGACWSVSGAYLELKTKELGCHT
jgi:hypothetical protein